MGLFRLFNPFWAWLLLRGDVFSGLLDGVGVSIRVRGTGMLCLSGVTLWEVLGAVYGLFVGLASSQLIVGLGRYLLQGR
jgi:hypothetical protein